MWYRRHFEGQEPGTKLGSRWRVEERMRMSGARTGDMYRHLPWHQCALFCAHYFCEATFSNSNTLWRIYSYLVGALYLVLNFATEPLWQKKNLDERRTPSSHVGKPEKTEGPAWTLLQQARAAAVAAAAPAAPTRAVATLMKTECECNATSGIFTKWPSAFRFTKFHLQSCLAYCLGTVTASDRSQHGFHQYHNKTISSSFVSAISIASFIQFFISEHTKISWWCQIQQNPVNRYGPPKKPITLQKHTRQL